MLTAGLPHTLGGPRSRGSLGSRSSALPCAGSRAALRQQTCGVAHQRSQMVRVTGCRPVLHTLIRSCRCSQRCENPVNGSFPFAILRQGALLKLVGRGITTAAHMLQHANTLLQGILLGNKRKDCASAAVSACTHSSSSSHKPCPHWRDTASYSHPAISHTLLRHLVRGAQCSQQWICCVSVLRGIGHLHLRGHESNSEKASCKLHERRDDLHSGEAQRVGTLVRLLAQLLRGGGRQQGARERQLDVRLDGPRRAAQHGGQRLQQRRARPLGCARPQPRARRRDLRARLRCLMTAVTTSRQRLLRAGDRTS